MTAISEQDVVSSTVLFESANGTWHGIWTSH